MRKLFKSLPLNCEFVLVGVDQIPSYDGEMEFALQIFGDTLKEKAIKLLERNGIDLDDERLQRYMEHFQVLPMREYLETEDWKGELSEEYVEGWLGHWRSIPVDERATLGTFKQGGFFQDGRGDLVLQVIAD